MKKIFKVLGIIGAVIWVVFLLHVAFFQTVFAVGAVTIGAWWFTNGRYGP